MQGDRAFLLGFVSSKPLGLCTNHDRPLPFIVYASTYVPETAIDERAKRKVRRALSGAESGIHRRHKLHFIHASDLIQVRRTTKTIEMTSTDYSKREKKVYSHVQFWRWPKRFAVILNQTQDRFLLVMWSLSARFSGSSVG